MSDPGRITIDGDVAETVRDQCRLESVLGAKDTWTLSGQQWGAWNAAFGPRGDDGLPVPLWDERTGVINRLAAKHWKKYDLRLVLERDWKDLAPKLQGKLHIWVGEADDYFLGNAVHRLDDFLSKATPAYGGTIVYGQRQGHCWSGLTEQQMLEQMMETVRKAGVRGGGVERKAEPIDSPRLTTLVREVEAGRRNAIEEFWRGVRGNAPLIEAVAGDDATFWVTYLWRAADDPGRLLLIGGVPADRSKPLSRLAGTDVWYWTERTPRNAHAGMASSSGPLAAGSPPGSCRTPWERGPMTGGPSSSCPGRRRNPGRSGPQG